MARGAGALLSTAIVCNGSLDATTAYGYDVARSISQRVEMELADSALDQPVLNRATRDSGDERRYDASFNLARASARLGDYRLAPNTAMPSIKPGASGGPTARKPLGQPVRESAIADNLATTGADVPTCVWCRMETPNPHIDDATPRCPGGNATLENAQVSCPHCNMSRGNRSAPVKSLASSRVSTPRSLR